MLIVQHMLQIKNSSLPLYPNSESGINLDPDQDPDPQS
jgi:hypothetical protein